MNISALIDPLTLTDDPITIHTGAESITGVILPFEEYARYLGLAFGIDLENIYADPDCVYIGVDQSTLLAEGKHLEAKQFWVIDKRVITGISFAYSRDPRLARPSTRRYWQATILDQLL